MNRAIIITASLLSVPLLAACSKSEQSSTTQANQQSAASSTWLLVSAPSNDRAVADVKSNATDGEQVTVRGYIGGRLEPITHDSPVFVITDSSIPDCNRLHPGHCDTPWDYCCETPESLAANTATVQLVDASGAPLNVDPIASGLDPLDEIIVVGTVAPRPDKSILTILATGVHILPPQNPADSHDH